MRSATRPETTTLKPCFETTSSIKAAAGADDDESDESAFSTAASCDSRAEQRKTSPGFSPKTAAASPSPSRAACRALPAAPPSSARARKVATGSLPKVRWRCSSPLAAAARRPSSLRMLALKPTTTDAGTVPDANNARDVRR